MSTVPNRDATRFGHSPELGGATRFGHSPDLGGAISTSLRRLLLLDVAVTIAHTGLWLLLNLVTPTIAVLANLVRIAAWIAYAQHSIGPVREWIRRDDPDPESRRLLAAHTVLESHARRVAITYLICWAFCDALWLALAYVGVPAELPVGRAELLAATMIASSLLLTPLLIEPVLDHALFSLQGEVRGALVEQRRDVDLAAPTINRVMSG
jgi:hypothetical protein